MSVSKKTIVLGASTNPERYAYEAVVRLKKQGHVVVPVGIKKGEISGLGIENAEKIHSDVDTITIYLNPTLQEQYFDYIVKTNPKRVILNPGTENQRMVEFCLANNIQPLQACTLVLLSIGNY